MRVQCYGTCPAVVSRSLGYLGLEAISKLKDLTHALIPYLVTRYLIVFWPPLGKTHWTACTGWPVTGTRATSQLCSTLSSPTSMSVSSSPVPNATPPVPNATPPVPNATHPPAHGERVDRRYGEVSPAPYHTPIHTPTPHTPIHTYTPHTPIHTSTPRTHPYTHPYHPQHTPHTHTIPHTLHTPLHTHPLHTHTLTHTHPLHTTHTRSRKS